MFITADVVFTQNLPSREIRIGVSYYDHHAELQEDCVYITKDMLKEVLESGEE